MDANHVFSAHWLEVQGAVRRALLGEQYCFSDFPEFTSLVSFAVGCDVDERKGFGAVDSNRLPHLPYHITHLDHYRNLKMWAANWPSPTAVAVTGVMTVPPVGIPEEVEYLLEFSVIC